MKRSYWGMVLSMIAVFASGIGVGALGYHSYTVKTVNATTATQPPKRNPEEFRRMYVEELRSRLSLKEDQVATLNGILDDTRNQYHALKSKQKQEADNLRVSQQGKIRAMLDQTQLAEYDKFREERDRKMKAEQAAREQAAQAQSAK